MPRINLSDPLVKEFISTHAGEQGYGVLKTLGKGKTDEQISRKLDIRVNDIRAVLNTLHYMGIIRYTKIRDRPNWYTYTWFLREDRVIELLKEKYSEELAKLAEKMKFEDTYTFFRCGKKCDKLPFELAFEYDFRCPECGAALKEYDNSRDKRSIKRKVGQINKLLASFDNPQPVKTSGKKPVVKKKASKKAASTKNKRAASRKKKS